MQLWSSMFLPSLIFRAGSVMLSLMVFIMPRHATSKPVLSAMEMIIRAKRPFLSIMFLRMYRSKIFIAF